MSFTGLSTFSSLVELEFESPVLEQAKNPNVNRTQAQRCRVADTYGDMQPALDRKYARCQPLEACVAKLSHLVHRSAAQWGCAAKLAHQRHPEQARSAAVSRPRSPPKTPRPPTNGARQPRVGRRYARTPDTRLACRTWIPMGTPIQANGLAWIGAQDPAAIPSYFAGSPRVLAECDKPGGYSPMQLA